jgi:RNA recognition motif-containing protein
MVMVRMQVICTSFKTREYHIIDFFAGKGLIISSIQMPVDRNGRSKGYAFITIEDSEVDLALEQFSSKNYKEHGFIVRIADPEREGREARGYYYDKDKKNDFRNACESRIPPPPCAICDNTREELGGIYYPSGTDWEETKHVFGARRSWFTIDHKKAVQTWEDKFYQKHGERPSYNRAFAFFNKVENWQPAHWSCNSKKRDHLLFEISSISPIPPIPPLDERPSTMHDRRESFDRLSGDRRGRK